MALNLKELLARKGEDANDNTTSGKVSDAIEAIRKIAGDDGATAIALNRSDPPPKQLEDCFRQIVIEFMANHDVVAKDAIAVAASLYYSLVASLVAPSKMKEFLDAVNPNHEMAHKRLLAISANKVALGYEENHRNMASFVRSAKDSGRKLDDELMKEAIKKFGTQSSRILEAAHNALPPELRDEADPVVVDDFMIHSVTGAEILDE